MTDHPLDDFLAAPDSLRHSEVEKEKARKRKAKALAEDKQLAATKSAELPTVEDALADLIRCATDEENNPFAKFKTLSRQRYRIWGWYPVEIIDKMFGQFNHALEVAGLRDQPGTRAKKAALAEKSRWEHTRRYVERHILPYARREPEWDRAVENTKLILSISDTHATFLDPFTWHCFLRACRDLQPEIVLLNGDILEGSELSRWPKIKGATIDLQVEFDFCREMFRQLREVVSPDCRIIWTAGNHGLDRLAKYMTQISTAFSELRDMKFDKLAGLDDYDVILSQGGWISSPEGTEEEPEGMLLHQFYRIYHGRKMGATPALSELRQANRSGQSGHLHRAQVIYGTTERDQGMSWMSTPAGCTRRATAGYLRGLTNGHQKGFGVAFLMPNNRVHQYPVITDGDLAVCEGYHYTRPGKIIEPDVLTNWLPNLELPS